MEARAANHYLIARGRRCNEAGDIESGSPPSFQRLCRLTRCSCSRCPLPRPRPSSAGGNAIQLHPTGARACARCGHRSRAATHPTALAVASPSVSIPRCSVPHRRRRAVPLWRYKVARKLRIVAKIAQIRKLVKIAQKLHCATSQFSGGTN